MTLFEQFVSDMDNKTVEEVVISLIGISEEEFCDLACDITVMALQRIATHDETKLASKMFVAGIWLAKVHK